MTDKRVSVTDKVSYWKDRAEIAEKTLDLVRDAQRTEQTNYRRNLGAFKTQRIKFREKVGKLTDENDRLRGIIAKSDLPCLYCGLAAADMAKCPSGFPGCGRGDDMLNDPAMENVSER